MVRHAIPAGLCTAVALMLLLAAPAAAQPQAPAATATAPESFDCGMLARLPQAPMTVQACEQRMAAQRELMEALKSPGGARPGDERLTCEAIMAEMLSLRVTGVPPGQAAAGEAAARDFQSILQRAMAEGMGLSAGLSARGIAAAALPGNAAGHAAATAALAEQRALQDRTATQLNPARERLQAANNDAIGELVKAMRAHPRFGRLVGLGMERDCQT